MNHDPVIGALQTIRERKPNFQPKAAFILGSGLGVLADELQDKVVIPYEELEGFPVSTVQGHSGELVLGTMGGVDVVCMKGRGHYYEHGSMKVMTTPVRTFKKLAVSFCSSPTRQAHFALNASTSVLWWYFMTTSIPCLSRQ